MLHEPVLANSSGGEKLTGDILMQAKSNNKLPTWIFHSTPTAGRKKLISIIHKNIVHNGAKLQHKNRKISIWLDSRKNEKLRSLSCIVVTRIPANVADEKEKPFVHALK